MFSPDHVLLMWTIFLGVYLLWDMFRIVVVVIPNVIQNQQRSRHIFEVVFSLLYYAYFGWFAYTYFLKGIYHV